MRNTLLALLAEGSGHGYELKQAIEQTFGDAMPQINIGQVYTTLGRLERDGLVASAHVAQAGRPDKRVYELTEMGREEVRRWLAEPVNGPRLKDEFFTKLVLARLPGVAALNGGTDARALIARQRRDYLQSLRDLNGLLLRQSRDGGPTSAELLIEGAILHLEADLKWLDLCEQRLT
ncbi:MAG TPA: PadR family transcriptional regulator [Thermomicrobiales bacterium]|nr:PadR family transcriptional regulator [Thermomicrobiales bacterium]